MTFVELAAIGGGDARSGLYDSNNVATSAFSAQKTEVEAFEITAAAGANWTSSAPDGGVGGSKRVQAGMLSAFLISPGAEKTTVQVVAAGAGALVLWTVKSVRFSTSDRAFLNSCSSTGSLLLSAVVLVNGTSPFPTIITPDSSSTVNVHFSWTGRAAVDGVEVGGATTGLGWVNAAVNVTSTSEKFASIAIELFE